MADFDNSTNAKSGSKSGIGLLVVAGLVVLVLLWAIFAGGGTSIDNAVPDAAAPAAIEDTAPALPE